MKNKGFILLSLFVVIAAFSYAQTFTEGFDGLTFPPLDWTVNGVVRVNSTVTPPHTTPYSVEFNATSDELITPLLVSPVSMQYWHKKGTGNYQFYLDYSSSPTGPWTVFPGYPIWASNGWGTQTVNLTGYTNVYLRFRPQPTPPPAKIFYIDSVTIDLGEECLPPTIQATNITFPTVGINSLGINWARGNGDYCVAFLHQGPGVPSNPIDGTVYTPSADWSMPGTQLGTSGYYCIYRGIGNSVTVTNLLPLTNYWVVVYEFNCDGVAAHFLYPGAENNATTLDPNVPVELSSFTATVNQQYYVVLNWSTESETEAIGYNVFRYETNNMTDAYKVNLTMIPATNTSSETHYSFIDKEAALGTWYYWLESKNLSGVSDFFGPISIVITDGTGSTVTPDLTSLSRLFPNPFNPGGTYLTGTYDIAKSENILVAVYNIKGEKVRTIANGAKHAGSYPISWNGFNDNGKMCPTGVYYLILKTDDSITTRKIVMMK